MLSLFPSGAAEVSSVPLRLCAVLTMLKPLKHESRLERMPAAEEELRRRAELSDPPAAGAGSWSGLPVMIPEI